MGDKRAFLFWFVVKDVFIVAGVVAAQSAGWRDWGQVPLNGWRSVGWELPLPRDMLRGDHQILWGDDVGEIVLDALDSLQMDCWIPYSRCDGIFAAVEDYAEPEYNIEKIAFLFLCVWNIGGDYAEPEYNMEKRVGPVLYQSYQCSL